MREYSGMKLDGRELQLEIIAASNVGLAPLPIQARLSGRGASKVPQRVPLGLLPARSSVQRDPVHGRRERRRIGRRVDGVRRRDGAGGGGRRVGRRARAAHEWLERAASRMGGGARRRPPRAVFGRQRELARAAAGGRRAAAEPSGLLRLP